MQYQGGKSRLSRQIAQLMLRAVPDRHTYLEPFLGAGSIAAKMAPKFKKATLSDANPNIVELWKALQAGWKPPTHISEQQYNDLRNDEPSPLRTFAGFGCSWGGKWFGGFARGESRNFAWEGSVRLQRYALRLRDATIVHADFRDHEPTPGTVVYCDPPYEGTTDYDGVPPFDHHAFWAWCNLTAANGCHVFVSEFNAPAGWRVALEIERAVHIGANTAGLERRREVDRLYYRGRAYPSV